MIDMKILVTGGCGFIGSNLAESLVDNGHDVTVLDNYLLGRNENIEKIKAKIKLVKGDIRNEKLVMKLTNNTDIIFNEAAASSSPMFMKTLKDAVSANVDGFINILNAAKENYVKRVIYASTSSIYGNQKLLKENMLTTPPNFYAVTKLMNEHLAILFGQNYDLETVGFRYMSVYGPNENSKGIYANIATQFLKDMKNGKSPVIYGDGTQMRDFIYVKDVVKANILAMNSKKKMIGEVLNVGTGNSTSLNKLVRIINKTIGKNIKPTYVKNTVKNYIQVQKADITRCKKTIGFIPDFTLEQGLKKMYNCY